MFLIPKGNQGSDSNVTKPKADMTELSIQFVSKHLCTPTACKAGPCGVFERDEENLKPCPRIYHR